MRQFTGLFFLMVFAVCATGNFVCSYALGQTGDAQLSVVGTLELDRGFQFGDTNITDIRDIELCPDGRIAYGGLGNWATVGTAAEDGAVPPWQFGGGNLAVAQSVAVDAEDRAVFGGGISRYDWAVCRTVGLGSDFSWSYRGRLGGTAFKVVSLPNQGLLVAGNLTVPGETNEFFGLVQLGLSGAVDQRFDFRGSAGLEVTDAVRLGDGRILASYRRTNQVGATVYGFGRWESNGARDVSYNFAETSERRVSAIRHAPGEHLIAAVEEIAPRRTRLIPLSASGMSVAPLNPFENIWIDGEVRALAFETVRPETAAKGEYDNIIVGGSFTNVGGFPCNNLAALSVGGVEWCFSTDEGPDGAIHAVEVQLDGKVLIGGSFTNVSGVEARGMARLAHRASERTYLYWADSEFRAFEKGGTGELLLRRKGPTNEALTVELEITPLAEAGTPDLGIVPSQAIILAGESSVRVRLSVNDDALRENRELFHVRAVATNTSVLVTRAATEFVILDDETPGTIDPSFRIAAAGAFQTFGLQRDGKVIVGGDGVNLTRLNGDGSVDPTFVTNGIPDTDWAASISQILPQPDGKIYVAGRFNVSTTPAGINHLARLNEDGTLDGSFDPRFYKAAGSGIPTDQVFIDVLDNGTVVAWTGRSIRREGMHSRGILWLGKNGEDIGTWPWQTLSSWVDYVELEHLPNRDVFAYTGPVSPRGIKKIRADGSPDTNFVALVPLIDDHINDLLAVGDSLYAGGRLSTVNSVSVSNLVKLDVISGALDTNFNVAINGRVLALEEHGGKLYVSGEFTEVNGRERRRLARLNLDGSLDETFDAGLGPNLAPWHLKVQPDGKLLMGTTFTRVDGVASAGLVRLEGDNPFSPEMIPPSVEILWPTNGTEIVLSDVVEPFEVEVKAFDVDGFLESVAVELDGVAVATNSTGGRFYLQRPSAGDHVLKVTATDEHGVQSSDMVRFHVSEMPWPGLVEVRRDEGGVVISYPTARLQGTTDLRTWIDAHSGGGEFRPNASERYRFFRIAF